tara:strand:- start:246 stop:2255 length:2010 start_codon:yes stop_codon:yes gene_type:complete
MAIPIKILAGHDGEIAVDLEAQSIDMVIDRNISAFPTPNNLLKRIAIDTNIPRVTMEINGILTDDEGIDVTRASGVEDLISVTPMRTLINFGSLMPTEPNSNFTPVKRALGTNRPVADTLELFVRNSLSRNSTNTVEDLDIDPTLVTAAGVLQMVTKIQTNLKFTGAHSVGATGALAVSASISGVSTPANVLISKDDRIVKSTGELIGIVQSVTDTTVTFTAGIAHSISANDLLFASAKCFNHRNEFLGYTTNLTFNTTGAKNITSVDLTLDRKIESDILEGTRLTFNKSNDSLENLLHHNCVKIIPSYWLEDSSRGPTGSDPRSDVAFSNNVYPKYGIKFIFDATKTPAIAGGSDTPALNTGNQIFERTSFHQGYCTPPALDAAFRDLEILIPIKGITTLPDNQSPAEGLALLLSQALALTTTFTKTAKNDSFTLNPTGTSTLAATFNVTRNNSIVLIEQTYKPQTPVEHPEIFNDRLKETVNIQAFNSISAFSSFGIKSAGDKAQDLIGLISNSSTNTGDLFKGIQIPYDSLITSSGVTGVARNFFLTFGEIPASEKTSLSNTRAASDTMLGLQLTGDAGGNKTDRSDNEKSLLEEWFGSAGEAIESLVGFVTTAISDIFITLKSDAHGNDGGIRIIPEKLHVRYDAGNNYYAYSLLLVATDFVIGV